MLIQELLTKSSINNLKFANKLHNKYKKGNRDSDPQAFADIITVLKLIFNFSDEKIEQDIMITDGRNDGSIDSVVFKNKCIYIFDVKGGKNNFEANPIIKFLGDVEDYVINEDIDISPLNDRVKDKINKARKKYHDENWQIKLVIARPYSNENIDKRIQSKLEALCQTDNVSYETINLNTAKDYILSKKVTEDYLWNLKIDKRNNKIDDDGDSLIAKIEITKIIRLIQELGENEVFDKNVRIDQKDKFIKAKIKNTLKKEKDKFYIYHNGLTISSSKITPRGTTYIIKNPQIINGCQSASAIYKLLNEGKIDNKDLEKCFIICKIFSSQNKHFINEICQSSNTQRPIQTWDLRTNDDEQIIIEKMLDSLGYKYVRKKARGAKGVSITELGQWIYSCEFEEPADAKSKKKSIFDISNNLYQKIFDIEKLTDEKLKNICDTAMFVKKMIRAEKRRDKKSFYKIADFHIMAIFYKKFKVFNKFSFNKAVKLIEAAAKKMLKEFGPDYGYNNVFKNSKTWSKIKK